MNAEMTAKLSKYMKEDGTYDIAALRGEFPGNPRRALDAIFDLFDRDSTNEQREAAKTDDGMSAEWRAAVEHNAAVEARRGAEQAANPEQVAQEVMTVIVTTPEYDDAERAVMNVTAQSAKIALVKLMLAKLDELNLISKNNTETNAEEKRRNSTRYNRILFLLHEMNLADERGDFADQTGYFNLDKAYTFIAGQTESPAPLWNTDTPEENLNKF